MGLVTHKPVTKQRIKSRLLPNRSPVAWGTQENALGALVFGSST